MQTIHDFWENYRKNYIPASAPLEQFVECRRAFYMGAANIMMLNLKIADLERKEGEKIMEDTYAELLEFKKKMEEGQA